MSFLLIKINLISFLKALGNNKVDGHKVMQKKFKKKYPY